MATFHYEINIDFDEFLEKYAFEDNTGAYNCMLIEVDDVKDFWNRYRHDIGSNISNIYDCLSVITRNIEDIEETL